MQQRDAKYVENPWKIEKQPEDQCEEAHRSSPKKKITK